MPRRVSEAEKMTATGRIKLPESKKRPFFWFGLAWLGLEQALGLGPDSNQVHIQMITASYFEEITFTPTDIRKMLFPRQVSPGTTAAPAT